MSPVDLIFTAVENSLLSIESRLDDPRWAHEKEALENSHLTLSIFRSQLVQTLTQPRG